MFFTPLHELALRATLHIMIVAEGDQLRVTVQPKPTGKNEPVPPALSLLASPEEFDCDFLAAVTGYKSATLSLLDQASTAAKAVAETKVEKSKADKPAATKPATSKKSTPAKKAAPAKPAAPAKAAPTKAPKASTPARKTPAAKPAEAPVDKDALVAMMRDYLAQLDANKKPSRVDFIKKFKSGRRYERVFGTFNELVAAAQQQPLALDAQPKAAAQEAPQAEDATGAAAGATGAAAPSATAPDAEAAQTTTQPETVDASASPAAAQSADAAQDDGMPALSLI